MLPAPLTLLEAALWEVHARLDEARSSGRGVTAVDDEVKATIASYLAAGPEHVQALRAFLMRLDAEISHLQREHSRTQLAIEAGEADRLRFRAHALNAMKAAGATQACGVTGRPVISIARSQRTLEVASPEQLPEKFRHVVPEQVRVRERDLRAAVEAGETIPGVLLVEGGMRLVVR